MHSTSAIVGEVQKSEVSDDDENALIADISDIFNVDMSKNKPAKKPVAKPTSEGVYPPVYSKYTEDS